MRSEIVMPYELFNQSTTISRKLSRQFWKKTLELARMYGWRPMGTQAPSYHDSNRLNADWHGTYMSNEGQTVLREDAIAMAEALQKSLDDIPDFNGEVDWNPKFWVDDDLPDWLSPDEKETIEDGLEEEAGEDDDADDGMGLVDLSVVSRAHCLAVWQYPPVSFHSQCRCLDRMPQCKADMQSLGRQHGPRRVR